MSEVVGLVSNAGSLLTPRFVNQTHTLIGGAVPLISSLEELDLAAVVALVAPLLRELDGLDLTGLVEAVKPLLAMVKKLDVQALVDQLLPLLTPESIGAIVALLENAGALLSRAFVEQTSELIGDATPLVATVADLVQAILKEFVGKR
ncbi:hypothetical protein VTK26DRAFT_4012 [Humicola hyalothermophila]